METTLQNITAPPCVELVASEQVGTDPYLTPKMGVRSSNYGKLPKNEVKALYLSGQSSNAIGKRFGVSTSSVLDCLKRMGVPRLSNTEAQLLSVAMGRNVGISRTMSGERFNSFEAREGFVVLFAESKSGAKYEILVDSADCERLQAYGHRVYVVRRKHTNYAKIAGTTGMIYLHHFIVGSSSRQFDVDHINHNGLDNRSENLRVVTKSINRLNRKGPRKGSKSGIRGAVWSSQKQKWQAIIKQNDHRFYLGFFDDKEEAGRVVQEKLKQIMEEACVAS